MTLTVAHLAKKTGLKPDTVRYYERVGLLDPPARTPSGYRQFDDGAVERIMFVRNGQRIGLRLADIRELLEIRDGGQCPCGHTRSLVERRVAQVKEEISRLRAVEAELRRMLTDGDGSTYEWCCPDTGSTSQGG